MEIERNSALFKKFVHDYWDYYLELENEFLQTRRYVDFSEGNYHCYSVEFLKLFQAVCAEIDVLGKMMANTVNPTYSLNSRNKGILSWWYEVQNQYTIDVTRIEDRMLGNSRDVLKLNEYSCIFLDRIELQPWKGFSVEKRGKSYRCHNKPEWWDDYNSVKHARTIFNESEASGSNYQKANLWNLMLAFSALYILEGAYLEKIGTVDDLQSFATPSALFVTKRFMTNNELDQILDKLWSQ